MLPPAGRAAPPRPGRSSAALRRAALQGELPWPRAGDRDAGTRREGRAGAGGGERGRARGRSLPPSPGCPPSASRSLALCVGRLPRCGCETDGWQIRRELLKGSPVPGSHPPELVCTGWVGLGRLWKRSQPTAGVLLTEGAEGRCCLPGTLSRKLGDQAWSLEAGGRTEAPC